MRYTTLTKADPIGRLIAGAIHRVPGGSGTINVREVTAGLATPTRAPIGRGDWRSEPIPPSIMRGAVSRTAPARIAAGSLRESLPASVTRSIIPAILGSPSTPISTASMGGGAIAQAPAPASGLGGGLGEIGTQLGGGLTNIGSSISKTATDYLPLAIKVVIAVIVIKIVLWLVRAGGRRR